MSDLPPPPPPPIGQPEPLPWAEVREPVAPPAPLSDAVDLEFDLVDEPVVPKRRPTKAQATKRVSGRVAALMRGDITIDDLDDEELQRGQMRDSDGKFRGRPASMVPRAMHDEMVRRLLTRGTERFRQDYFGAIDTMVEIMQDVDVDAGVRLRAADMLITRVAGKPIDKVELSVEIKPWEKMVRGIMREVPKSIGELVVDPAGEEDNDV